MKTFVYIKWSLIVWLVSSVNVLFVCLFVCLFSVVLSTKDGIHVERVVQPFSMCLVSYMLTFHLDLVRSFVIFGKEFWVAFCNESISLDCLNVWIATSLCCVKNQYEHVLFLHQFIPWIIHFVVSSSCGSEEICMDDDYLIIPEM